jgi:hypothetical protein
MSKKFADDEIALFLSRDMEAILAKYATDYVIIIGEEAFTPFWLYVNEPYDYETVGITPEMIEERLEFYDELFFTAEAAAAFETKLSEFTGREVRLARGLQNYQGNDDDPISSMN